MIGPLVVPKPLLAILIARRLTNTGNRDGRRKRRGKNDANLRHDSLGESCNKHNLNLNINDHYNHITKVIQNKLNIARYKIHMKTFELSQLTGHNERKIS